MDDLSNIIELTGENGEVLQFEFLAVVDYNGGEYVVLLPVEDDDSGEVVILKVEPADDHEEDSYVCPSDEDTMAVLEIFKEQFSDMITFEDQ